MSLQENELPKLISEITMKVHHFELGREHEGKQLSCKHGIAKPPPSPLPEADLFSVFSRNFAAF